MTLTEATKALRGSRQGVEALRALEVFLRSVDGLPPAPCDESSAVMELVRRFLTRDPQCVLEAIQEALTEAACS